MEYQGSSWREWVCSDANGMMRQLTLTPSPLVREGWRGRRMIAVLQKRIRRNARNLPWESVIADADQRLTQPVLFDFAVNRGGIHPGPVGNFLDMAAAHLE